MPLALEPTPQPSAARTALLLAPVVLASLVMAAHFLRFMVLPLVAVAVLLPLLLVFRRLWAVRIVQAWLCAGVVMWAVTTSSLVEQRRLEGQPHLRLALILGGVALVTLGAVLLLETPRLRRALRGGWVFEAQGGEPRL